MKVSIFLAFVLFFLIKLTASQYKPWENLKIKYPQSSKNYMNNYDNYKKNYGKQNFYGNSYVKQNLYEKNHPLDLIEIDDQITEIALKAETYLDAEKFARKFGFKNLGRVSNLPNTYNLVKDKSETNRYPRKSNYSDQINHHKKVFLNYKHKIFFFENQVPLKRYKRDYLDDDKINSVIDDELLLNRASNSRQGYLLNFPFFGSSKTDWNTEKTKPVVFENGPVFFHTEDYSNLGFNQNKHSNSNKNHHSSNQQVTSNKGFNDELFEKQWYLNDKFSKDNLAFNSLNVKEAWNLGYTGKGVVVTVIDDGLEWNHTDLIKNYDPKASIDLNGRDDDPSPSYSDENAHGTRCAGEIAMTAGNRKCGVGIAYNSKIGGIRLLDGSVVDIKEAQSFLHNFHYVDIFSSSWGPNDDGETLDGPKPLAKEALQRGAQYGRKGLGNIYVWASGNGGRKGDNCNCDGYVGSIYTLAIGSVGQNGQFPWYGERCSAIHAVTYSSNSAGEEKIATTDIRNSCTIQHSGTSAAAPLAAGILALLLEANPNLTWRDVQHLVVWTSSFLPMRKSPGWRQNRIGLLYNDRFGFGMMDAGELVKKSLNWKQVPPFHSCTINLKRGFPIYFDEAETTLITFESNSCRGTKNEVNFIEHVQVLLDIKLPVRGQLELFLVSPSGTGSILLTKRKNDSTRMGFTNWNFTSVHFWGEQPSGTWKLFLKRGGLGGEVSFAKLFIHGTSEKPNHMIEEPKKIYKNFNGNLNSILDYTMEFDNELKKKKTEQNLFQDIYDWSKKIQDVNDYNDDDMMVGRSGKINFGSFKKPFRKHF